jgi:hypothetical protein
MSKAKTLFNIFKQLISAFWKLFMLGVYTSSKIIEGFAKLLAKISEKFID